MKRSLLIILGILFVLILIGVWVYVLLTGSTENNPTGQFNEFEFGDTTDPRADSFSNQSEPEPVVNVQNGKSLQQLTTKRVAGFTEVFHSTSTDPYVHYVEAGTGHIYRINLVTGEEERISATTIPLTTQAVLTPNGAHVMMRAGQTTDTEYIVGSLATSSDVLSNFALNENILSFTATEENEFLYTVATTNETVAKAYNPRTNASRVLFTVPFRETAVSWHHTAAGPHLVYPKAASQLEGFVYSYKNGIRTRLPISGYGLSAVGSNEAVIYSESTVDGYVTSGHSDTNTLSQPISVVPEKCVFSPVNTSDAICGASLVTYSNQMPDLWYQGELSISDDLWSLQPSSGSATFLTDVSEEAGQVVDIVNPLFNTNGSSIYFQNKIDQTLWKYTVN